MKKPAEPPLKKLYLDCEKRCIALEKENAELQSRLVSVEVKNQSLRNKIAALTKELAKRPTLTEALSKLPGIENTHNNESKDG